MSVASNADVWPRHTCLASRWLHLCDYTTPLSSESVPHTHINQWCWSREMITWGVAGWSFRPHTENQPASAFSTSKPQAEAASSWNGIHESWQLMSEALHCKKCHDFFLPTVLTGRGNYIFNTCLFSILIHLLLEIALTLPSSSKPQHPSIGLISLSRLL